MRKSVRRIAYFSGWKCSIWVFQKVWVVSISTNRFQCAGVPIYLQIVDDKCRVLNNNTTERICVTWLNFICFECLIFIDLFVQSSYLQKQQYGDIQISTESTEWNIISIILYALFDDHAQQSDLNFFFVLWLMLLYSFFSWTIPFLCRLIRAVHRDSWLFLSVHHQQNSTNVQPLLIWDR